jgi:hypothetical protein
VAAAPAVAVLVSEAVALPSVVAALAVQPVAALAAVAAQPSAAGAVEGRPLVEAAAVRAEAPAADSVATASLLLEGAVLSAPPHSAAVLSGFDRRAVCRALPFRYLAPLARSGNSGGLVRLAALAGCWDLHPAFPEVAERPWCRERAARWTSAAPRGMAPHRAQHWPA